jgi:PIN domain nuclease of toxin-antitoxin system
VVAATGHKDPGDCYLMATARVRRMPIISRDRAMQAIAATGYIDIVSC